MNGGNRQGSRSFLYVCGNRSHFVAFFRVRVDKLFFTGFRAIFLEVFGRLVLAEGITLSRKPTAKCPRNFRQYPCRSLSRGQANSTKRIANEGNVARSIISDIGKQRKYPCRE